MMRLLSSVVACLALVACVALEAPRIVGTSPTTMWDERTLQTPHMLAPMSVDEARSMAFAHDAAHTCEITARALRVKNRQRGWAVMEQCVRRPDFNNLELLLSPPWLEELRAQADYGSLVAHVIAVRGGDVTYDLRLCRRAKLAVFSLKAAVLEPENYQGKLVLMRGSVRSGRSVDGARALDIMETRVMAESEWVAHGSRVQSTTDSEQREFENNSVKRGLTDRFHRAEGAKVEVLHNVSVETGLELLAAVEGDAPFLESGTDYVLLLRFNGTREVVEGSEIAELPMATVVGYFEPENGLFARLGR